MGLRRPPGLPPVDKDFKGLTLDNYSDLEVDSDEEEGLMMKPVPPRELPVRTSKSIRRRKDFDSRKDEQSAGSRQG